MASRARPSYLYRQAAVIATTLDAWGYGWDVNEWRPTLHGWSLAMGWPRGEDGQAIAGGFATPPGACSVRLCITPELAEFMRCATQAEINALPVSFSAIKRSQRLLGLHHALTPGITPEQRAWWRERLADLITLDATSFASKHGAELADVQANSVRLLGKNMRKPDWWMAHEVGRALEHMSTTVAADFLHLSVEALQTLPILRHRQQHVDQVKEDALA